MREAAEGGRERRALAAEQMERRARREIPVQCCEDVQQAVRTEGVPAAGAAEPEEPWRVADPHPLDALQIVLRLPALDDREQVDGPVLRGAGAFAIETDGLRDAAEHLVAARGDLRLDGVVEAADEGEGKGGGSADVVGRPEQELAPELRRNESRAVAGDVEIAQRARDRQEPLEGRVGAPERPVVRWQRAIARDDGFPGESVGWRERWRWSESARGARGRRREAGRR
jgi:hypothetical protein